MKLFDFFRKWNELIFSPISLLVAALGWYLMYRFLGESSGVMPPGYLVNILFGAFIFYVAGFMASFGLKLNFPKYFHWMFDRESESFENQFKWRALCAFFILYCLAVWSLTSML